MNSIAIVDQPLASALLDDGNVQHDGDGHEQAGAAFPAYELEFGLRSILTPALERIPPDVIRDMMRSAASFSSSTSNASADHPPNLDLLADLVKVFIVEELNPIEVLTKSRCNNKYRIYKKRGDQCYTAKEESTEFCRISCGRKRNFKIKIEDMTKKTVFSIKRPFKCCESLSCFRPCQDEVSVYASDGTQLGYVRKAFSFWKPRYVVYDHDEEPKFEITGPVCPIKSCYIHIDFPIRAIGSDEVIANIQRKMAEPIREKIGDADTYKLTFSKDLDVKLKATLIGAVFLLDFMFFTN